MDEEVFYYFLIEAYLCAMRPSGGGLNLVWGAFNISGVNGSIIFIIGFAPFFALGSSIISS